MNFWFRAHNRSRQGVDDVSLLIKDRKDLVWRLLAGHGRIVANFHTAVDKMKK
jgi:hypothetical protein